ncbi:MAG: endo-1,4-beta-xylanase [Granulosicoccaceae bacterium]
MRQLLSLITCTALLAATPALARNHEQANHGQLSPELRQWSDQQINTWRKSSTTLLLNDSDGKPLANRPVRIRQTKQGYCFGSALNEWVREGNDHFKPSDPARFHQWFEQHFNCGTPASTLHWKLMEAEPGKDGVGVWYADGAIQWMFDRNMQMLGHAVSWENPELVPDWVKNAPDANALKKLFKGRIEHLVGRYNPWINHWVGINEMLDYDSISKRFDNGEFKFRPWLYQELKSYDPSLKLLVNEAHILAEPGRVDDYKALVTSLIADGAEIDIIGIQAHFWSKDQEFINFEEVKSRLDSLAELGLPIWITEFDYAHASETVRANQLEGFYRLAYAHPAVQAIKSWGFWEGAHWRADWGTPVALVEQDWRVTESGKRLGKLMGEWKSNAELNTNANGELEFRGFHGSYIAEYQNSSGNTVQKKFELYPQQ